MVIKIASTVYLQVIVGIWQVICSQEPCDFSHGRFSVIKKTYNKGGSEEYNFRNIKDINKAFNFEATDLVSLKELLAAKKGATYEIWLEAPNRFAGNEGERYLGVF